MEAFERSYFLMNAAELEAYEATRALERLVARPEISEPLRDLLAGALSALRDWTR